MLGIVLTCLITSVLLADQDYPDLSQGVQVLSMLANPYGANTYLIKDLNMQVPPYSQVVVCVGWKEWSGVSSKIKECSCGPVGKAVYKYCAINSIIVWIQVSIVNINVIRCTIIVISYNKRLTNYQLGWVCEELIWNYLTPACKKRKNQKKYYYFSWFFLFEMFFKMYKVFIVIKRRICQIWKLDKKHYFW